MLNKTETYIDPHLKKRPTHDNCSHSSTSDFSTVGFRGESIKHRFCHDCRSHWFRGKFYTEKQWEAYVEL